MKYSLISLTKTCQSIFNTKGGSLTEYRSQKCFQYSTITGPRRNQGPVLVEYWPFLEDLYSHTTDFWCPISYIVTV